MYNFQSPYAPIPVPANQPHAPFPTGAASTNPVAGGQTIAPGTITYTTTTAKDGTITYHPFRYALPLYPSQYLSPFSLAKSYPSKVFKMSNCITFIDCCITIAIQHHLVSLVVSNGAGTASEIIYGLIILQGSG
jgi:hypothetical protein